ncbi:MAG: hypothetical protein FJ390_05305 [Verrucomicrobia bacterium]|nr:hypothetical protein [Verrucomicrobiota bacterium]
MNNSIDNTLAALASSAARPGAEKREKNIRVLHSMEQILIEEVDRRIAETQDLINRLETAVDRRAAQKRENADFTDRSRNRYKRPGI